jgi:hypothetical protein
MGLKYLNTLSASKNTGWSSQDTRLSNGGVGSTFLGERRKTNVDSHDVMISIASHIHMFNFVRLQ